jgi:circadian clock protein KaiC
MRDKKSRNLAKMSTGISGLDECLRGGFPRGRTTVIAGGPGTGKTVMALQTLVNGVKDLGEAGIFVAFEEHSRQIIENARTFSWGIGGIPA